MIEQPGARVLGPTSQVGKTHHPERVSRCYYYKRPALCDTFNPTYLDAKVGIDGAAAVAAALVAERVACLREQAIGVAAQIKVSI